MQNYLCERCLTRWQGEGECPNCHEKHEIRKTISEEEAKERGLI